MFLHCQFGGVGLLYVGDVLYLKSEISVQLDFPFARDWFDRIREPDITSHQLCIANLSEFVLQLVGKFIAKEILINVASCFSDQMSFSIIINGQTQNTGDDEGMCERVHKLIVIAP